MARPDFDSGEEEKISVRRRASVDLPEQEQPEIATVMILDLLMEILSLGSGAMSRRGREDVRFGQGWREESCSALTRDGWGIVEGIFFSIVEID
jgi:hypothetical protein